MIYFPLFKQEMQDLQLMLGIFICQVKTTERQLPGETARGQPVVHDFPALKKTSTSHTSYSQPCV
jgi:hypothetical protein